MATRVITVSSPGPRGPQGPQGPAGLTGPSGSQGPQGEPGPSGSQGPQGTGLTILGSLPSTGSLPISSSTGDGYLIGGNLHIWDGSSWENVGNVQGPSGSIGPAGPTGPTGPSGSIGPIGPSGSIGPAGPSGSQGPQGPQGPTGPQGPQGIAGPSGSQGPSGSIGPVGPSGSQGVSGSEGPIGPPGSLISATNLIVTGTIWASGSEGHIVADQDLRARNNIVSKNYIISNTGSFDYIQGRNGLAFQAPQHPRVLYHNLVQGQSAGGGTVNYLGMPSGSQNYQWNYFDGITAHCIAPPSGIIDLELGGIGLSISGLISILTNVALGIGNQPNLPNSTAESSFYSWSMPGGGIEKASQYIGFYGPHTSGQVFHQKWDWYYPSYNFIIKGLTPGNFYEFFLYVRPESSTGDAGISFGKNSYVKITEVQLENQFQLLSGSLTGSIDTANLQTPTGSVFSLTGSEGPQGPPGPSGSQGPAGPSGSIGPAGPSGSIGPAGPSGSIGPAGPSGSIGPAGPSGSIGPAGPSGSIGPAGPSGSIGPAGPSGSIGPAGPSGSIGPAGPSGSIGPAGPSGSIGPAGPSGSIGSAGPSGSIGPAGPSGSIGPVGPSGSIGPAGPSGSIGPVGPSGSQGPPGPSGSQGPAGPSGSQGPVGPSGSKGDPGDIPSYTDLVISGSLWASGSTSNITASNNIIAENTIIGTEGLFDIIGGKTGDSFYSYRHPRILSMNVRGNQSNMTLTSGTNGEWGMLTNVSSSFTAPSNGMVEIEVANVKLAADTDNDIINLAISTTPSQVTPSPTLYDRPLPLYKSANVYWPVWKIILTGLTPSTSYTLYYYYFYESFNTSNQGTFTFYADTYAKVSEVH
jgi:hypothetical protein